MEVPSSPSTSSPELMRIGTLFRAPLCSRMSPKGRAWVLLLLGQVPSCQVRAAQVQPIRPFLYLPYLQTGWHPRTATNNPLGKCFPDAFQYYWERVPGESPLCCTESSPIHPYNLPQASHHQAQGLWISVLVWFRSLTTQCSGLPLGFCAQESLLAGLEGDPQRCWSSQATVSPNPIFSPAPCSTIFSCMAMAPSTYPDLFPASAPGLWTALVMPKV